MPDDVKRMLDNQEEMHKQDRDVLFENEKFLIGVLHVVSAGSVVAALSQSDQFVKPRFDLAVCARSWRWRVDLRRKGRERLIKRCRLVPSIFTGGGSHA
jgi:hypothetical protein